MKQPQFLEFKHWGIVSDLPPEEVPVNNWTSGSNFKFIDKACRMVGGYEAFADPLDGTGPIFAINCVDGATNYWIYCTSTAVFVTNGVDHFDITPAGMSLTFPGDWTGCILNGIPCLNNSRNEPYYWDFNTGGTLLPLPGWPAGATCEVIRAFKYHLFALNVSELSKQGSTLWWSIGADPGAIPSGWVPAPDNDAGDMTLADTPGDIVDGLALRDNFIVYKNDATYSLTYVAGQYVYVQRKIFLTSGLQNRNCIIEVNGMHYAFTGTDVIKHDGQNPVSVIQDKVRTELVGSIEPDRKTLCCITAKLVEQLVWVCIPTTGSGYLNKAYLINVQTDDVGIRLLPDVSYVARGVVNIGAGSIGWDSDTVPVAWQDDYESWDQQSYSPEADTLLMVSEKDNKLWAVDTQEKEDGQPVIAYLERQSLPVQNNIMRAYITRVLPRIEGRPGDVINIRVGGQAFFSQPIVWGDEQPFTIGTSVAIDANTEGRLISVSFRGQTEGVWKLHSYKLEAVDLGLY